MTTRLLRVWLVLGLLVAACGGDSTATDDGARLAIDLGCTSCHTRSGSAAAPSWVGLHDSTITLDDGSEVVADRDYIRQSILEPSARIREGYFATMPKFEVSNEQVDALVEHIVGLAD